MCRIMSGIYESDPAYRGGKGLVLIKEMGVQVLFF